MDGDRSFGGADVYVDPAAFCGVAARMLAAQGRDGVPAVLTLLAQALGAQVRLLEAGSTRAAIPKPRLRAVGGDESAAADAFPIDLPVRARDELVGVLTIEPRPEGLPPEWTAAPGPLATIADLFAMTLSAASSPEAGHVHTAARAWLDLDELDRAEQAGELHDGLIQSLVASRYLLDLAETTWPGGPQPWLAAVRESVQAALADGRKLLSSTQPRTRGGRSLRTALEELSASCPIPLELHATEATGDEDFGPSPQAVAASYRFVQAALIDLMARGGDAAKVHLVQGPSGVSIDINAIGDRPAWPDEPGPAMRRWASRIELLGGTCLLQCASAHLRFGPADGDCAQSLRDVRAGRM